MEKLKGFVEHIIYRNPDNGYAVISLMVEELEITCTGFLQTLMRGSVLRRKAPMWNMLCMEHSSR